ncbi:hypothetical protein NMK34_09220 [Micromonospora sp. BRA006-A]|uniref:hypothetical protein n=1 Tax=Micromonospora sp. BRA006-A TaxID=2962860 RepID=UPI00296FE034|nr:hypothetical protein [Micromonospora sp. BRA006-A]MDW3846786.1 hypothetical protein [Micromonospora sp. BRA006-A]
MRVRKRLIAAMTALALGAGIGVFGVAGPAYAGCQSISLHYRYYSGDTIKDWFRNCSGSYSLNSKGFYLYPGPWSGYVRFASGYDYPFCDWEEVDLEFVSRYFAAGNVKNMYLSPVKSPAC